MYDWESPEVTRLKNHLEAGSVIRNSEEDTLVWMASKTGSFSVESVYRFLAASFGSFSPTSKRIWVKHIPPRVQFFGWLAWKGKLKTAEFLTRIGVLHANDSSVCCLCKSGAETINHVLLSCQVAWSVWSAILKWWDVQGALPDSVEAVLDWWAGVRFTKKARLMWKALPMVVMWSLWNHRNECLFRDVAPSGEGVSDMVKVRMAFWFKEVYKDCRFSVHDFIFNLEHIRSCLGDAYRGVS
ncbi:unnamed protein product [Camellia sinensis]